MAVQEFRPAEVIEADSRLAQSVLDGDLGALESLVQRYGRAVSAVVATSSSTAQRGDAAGVFVAAWHDRDAVDPTGDFASWIGAHTAAAVGSSTDEIGDVWTVAMAIEGVDADARLSLRQFHLEGVAFLENVDRHELRLRRRLSHLGDDAAVAELLADPAPWVDPGDDVSAVVRSRLGLDGSAPPAGDGHGVAERRTPEDGDVVVMPGRVARSLRPVLLGLAGAVFVLFVAIIALSAASGSPDPIAFTEALTPTGAILDVEGGELTVTERDNGLRLDLDAPTLPRRGGDQYYEGVLVLQDGSEVTAGSFNEGFGVILSVGVALDRVEQFLVVTGELGSDVVDVVLKLDVPQS